MQAEPLDAPPPRPAHGGRRLDRSDAQAALRALETSPTGWVGGTKRIEQDGHSRYTHRTHKSAASAAHRLIVQLREIEPDSKFERRIWQAGSRFRWAIRRVNE